MVLRSTCVPSVCQPAHVTRLNRTKQYSATAVSSETQSYSIEFVPPHVMKADRGDNV